MPKLSVIIPLYNEQRYISRCLQALAAQTVELHEVIVVDNNSSDGSADIASAYPFVTVIKEPRQGCGVARAAGFDIATGDILARIDAHSIVRPDWAQHLIASFTDSPGLAGVSGLGTHQILPGVDASRGTLFSSSYYRFARASLRTNVLWGANMAIRAHWWQDVRHSVLPDDRYFIHEDQDLTLCVRAKGGVIACNPQMLMDTLERSYWDVRKYVAYGKRLRVTKQVHRHAGTLARARTPGMSFWSTLPGRIGAYSVMMYSFCMGLLVTPFILLTDRLARR